MIKRFIFTIIGLCVIIGVLAGVKAMQIGTLIAAGETMRPPPVSIASASVEEAEWDNSISAIGTLEAGQGVMITAEAPGRVDQLMFSGGERVSAGDVLVQQDVSSELSQLEQARSSLNLANSNFRRVSRLYNNNVLSRADFDAAKSQQSSAQAQLDGIQITIDKKQIVAPFDGRLGLSLVDVGQDISAGVSVVSLQALEPMLVNFSLPQQALARVQAGYEIQLTTDATPGRSFSGKINAINTQIDSVTRSVLVQATLDAADDADGAALLPGMYASVQVLLPQKTPVLTVPATAVSFATYGDSVFVIEEGDAGALTARQQFVQLGDRRGDFVAITKGLEAGQRVVSDGVFKLRNGAGIVISEDGKTEPSLTPDPDNT
jgi:membrane fusion protein (multidrug efflux system)